MRITGFILYPLSFILFLGCQGSPKSLPPIHLNPNMDNQPKFKPQSTNAFFADGAAMREPVPGTIARGALKEDEAYYFGKVTGSDKLIDKSPVPSTMTNLERGQERYGIYCAVCHGAVGDGRGAVAVAGKGMVPPPSFHTDLLRAYSDGKLFDIITNGVRTMPSYKVQVPVEDRWHIINYLRALQRSQYASMNDVPVNMRDQLESVR